MRWTLSRTAANSVAGDLLVFPVFQTKEKADLQPLIEFAKGKRKPPISIEEKIKASGFTAATGTLQTVFCSNSKAGWLLLVGMGESAKTDLNGIRTAAGKSASEARRKKAGKVLVHVPDADELPFDDETFARCWVEGAEMALSPTGVLKSEKKKDEVPQSWTLLGKGRQAAPMKRGIGEGEAYAAGCLFARELVNLPPNYLTPEDMAKQARKLASNEGLKIKVLGVPEMRKLKMGGILGVGQGSSNPPRLISLEYRGRPGAKKITLVGKGVTFDSGGISLKPGQGMDEMKADMGGAAAVLGAALTIARLKLPVNLQVLVPSAENMPDGGAIKPADVLTMANGKTVEVLNTDAEGRLILADALCYAERRKPDFVIDAATLTGACVVALGMEFAGLMGTDGELIEVLRQAGGETFERVWHLPLVDEHREQIKGTWSDLQNIAGGRWGGALTAAAFLSEFVNEDRAWAHVDIAGPAIPAKPTAICPKGGSGFGARLLARAVQILVS